jgi:DNA-binding response OmpR family regulator
MEHLDSGVRIVERLRAEERTRGLPILICSADITFLRERAEQLRRYECDFLEKPFEIDDLLGRVDSVLSRGSEHEGERGAVQPGGLSQVNGQVSCEGAPRALQHNVFSDPARGRGSSAPGRIDRCVSVQQW